MVKKNQVTVDLKYPIPNGGEGMIHQLTFGRLKAKHLKAMPKEMMAAAAEGESMSITAAEMVPIIAAVAELTEEQAGEIDIEDLPAVAEVIADFFEQYQGIGLESSGQ